MWYCCIICHSATALLLLPVQVQWSSLRPTQLPLMCVELVTSPSGVSMMLRCIICTVNCWCYAGIHGIKHPLTTCPHSHWHLSECNNYTMRNGSLGTSLLEVSMYELLLWSSLCMHKCILCCFMYPTCSDTAPASNKCRSVCFMWYRC